MYAKPIPFEQARVMALEYQVFIPEDFDFVKGGKLPGLYGGHEACSNGETASDCFSSRVMVRVSFTIQL